MVEAGLGVHAEYPRFLPLNHPELKLAVSQRMLTFAPPTWEKGVVEMESLFSDVTVTRGTSTLPLPHVN